MIAICQSGGEFVTNKDGSLSYSGGEAYALDIDHQTQLQDFKSELADMFNCIADTMTLKYFLPGNKKTLITISKDKDLQRMLNFLGDSSTAEIFIMSEEAAARNVSNMPASRYLNSCIQIMSFSSSFDYVFFFYLPACQVQKISQFYMMFQLVQ